MKLIAAGLFFIGAIVIFCFMYPRIKEYMDDSDKMDNLLKENETIDKRTEIFNLKIEQLNLMNKLLYYGSGMFLCLVISLGFVASYYELKLGNGCDSESKDIPSSSSQSSPSPSSTSVLSDI